MIPLGRILEYEPCSGPKKSLLYYYDRRLLRLLSRTVCPVSLLQSILLEYMEILLENRISMNSILYQGGQKDTDDGGGNSSFAL